MIKNYIPNSLKLGKHAIQQEKLYKVKFINGLEITTVIKDSVPIYYFHFDSFESFSKNPRSYNNICKYSTKLKKNIESKKYNTQYILSYELIRSEVVSVTTVYTYKTKGRFFEGYGNDYINIPQHALVEMGIDPESPLDVLERDLKQASLEIENYILKM